MAISFRRLQVSGSDRYVDKPEKNIYSHVCDAAQYLMLGAGEDSVMLGMDQYEGELDYSNLNRAAG